MSSRPAATLVEIPTSDRRRVLNRDVWTVTAVGDDGSLHVKHDRRGVSAVLPAGYVASDVVLGYATTIAGAQGRTVDRGHVIVTREPPRRRCTWACPAVATATTLTSSAIAMTTTSSSSETSPANKPSPRPPSGIPPGSCRRTASSSVGRPDRSIARRPEPPIANDARSPTGGRHENVGSHPQCALPSPAVTTRSSTSSYDSPTTTADDKRSRAPHHPSTGAMTAPPISSYSASAAPRRTTPISTRHTDAQRRTNDEPGGRRREWHLLRADHHHHHNLLATARDDALHYSIRR